MRGLPTAVTLAARVEGTAKILAQSLMTPSFRLYHTTDMRGVEIGGAAKNVLAIAAGIVAGKQLGASALAALISRGFAELMRFGEAYGAENATLTGLSGLGDLILSANSPQSRNFAYGYALGKGEPTPEKLAEGVFTAEILVKLARDKAIDMPICEAVNDVLTHKISADEAIKTLLSRPQKSEK
jgi:glycerol-3-phosphate dehydrogenase (NAD(P)+)